MNAQSEMQNNGFTCVDGLFASSELVQLDIAANKIEEIGRTKGGGRNILSMVPDILPIFKKPEILALISNHVGRVSGISEGIYLNKSEDANWLVAWHQDLFIRVKIKKELNGYGSWSIKEGQPFVQPPIEVLDNCLWLRINLDQNDEENGCLMVIPGSHGKGKISDNEIKELQTKEKEIALPCQRGESILFKPLLLHRSSKSRIPNSRRVFQVLYSGHIFQNGLEWPY